MSKPPNIESRILSEVERLHRFIVVWFRGAIEQDAEVFESEFTSRFHPDFVNIQPSGQRLSVHQIYNGHGSNPEFEIEIQDFELVQTSVDETLAVATYVEFQKNAKNSDPPDNKRFSTAAFTTDEQGIRWRHLQETAVQ